MYVIKLYCIKIKDKNLKIISYKYKISIKNSKLNIKQNKTKEINIKLRNKLILINLIITKNFTFIKLKLFLKSFIKLVNTYA